MPTLRSAFHYTLQRARLWADVWTSPQRAEATVLHLGPKRASKLAILAHFDVHGRIDAYALHYLEALTRCGFDAVLVSTCASLDNEDLQRAKAVCRGVMTRTNRGIDFGSWKAGLATLPDWQQYQHLLIANDSVFGPLFSLEPLFARATALNVDVVGMTDSYDSAPHLQSYFLLFDLRTPRCVAFVDRYFRRVRLLAGKQHTIWAYEVPLAARARRAGLTWSALFSAKDQPQWSTDRATNPTHDAWDSLILQQHFPFLKRELLTRNPRHVARTEAWPEVIRASGSDYDCDLVRRYLARTKTS